MWWLRTVGCSSLPSTSENSTTDRCKGMWQLTHLPANCVPILANLPQLAGLWQLRQYCEKASASRCGVWTLWQVLQVMLLER